ncbi:hypothetical protein GCM10018953_28020 [Streptosporangium nondiastaticum]
MDGPPGRVRRSRDGQPQQPPPQQPPPPPAGRGAAPPDAPVTATVDSSLTVSSCPRGQEAGSSERAIGRETSKEEPQERQRNS